MSPPGVKLDPELGIELEPFLNSSPGAHDASRVNEYRSNVMTRCWRRLFLRSAICAGLAVVALWLILARPREWQPRGPQCFIGHLPKDVPPYGPEQCFDNVNWTAINLPDSETTGLLHAHAFVQLPLDAITELSFLNQGNMANGSFRVSQNGASDSHVSVGVQAYYRDPAKLKLARVCRLHSAADKWGLGIFAPDVPEHDEGLDLKLNVNVVLPGTDGNGDPLAVQYLRTHMPHHEHWLAGLVDAIYIDPVTTPTLTSIVSPLPSSSTSSAPPAWTSGAKIHSVHPPYRCEFPDNNRA